MKPIWDKTLPTIASLGGTQEIVALRDGASLRVASFDAQGRTAPVAPKGTVLVAPGRTEFIEKYLEVANELTARGFDVTVFDWRGQGRSARPLANPQKGHVETYADYVEDLRELVETHIGARAISPLILLGHSMSGLAALLFMKRYPGRIGGAVLTSPMTAIDAGHPLMRAAVYPLLRFSFLPLIGHRYTPGFGDYRPGRRFAGNPLTHDETRFRIIDRYIEAEPALALGGPTLRWLAASHAAMAELRRWRPTGPLGTPTMMVSAVPDPVVGHRTQQQLCDRLPDCRFEALAGSGHEILMERDAVRRKFWTLFDDFVAGLAPISSSA